jgi:hypothetical protein
MLTATALRARAARAGSQSQWLARGRRDHTAIAAARSASGMQPIRAMVKGVRAAELAPGGKRPVTGRRALPGKPGSRNAGSADLNAVPKVVAGNRLGA